jgi:hypothetical protein
VRIDSFDASIGPNVKRLRECGVVGSLAASVHAGPGDLLEWCVTVTIHRDDLPVHCTGRGHDLEEAAAALMPVLTRAGVEPRVPADDAVAGSG